MANSKIDLFFTVEGFDAHIEIVPTEGESGFKLLQTTVKGLKSIGALPRTVPTSGGSAKPPAATTEPATCPECGSTKATIKSGVGKNGRAYRLLKCACGLEQFLKAK